MTDADTIAVLRDAQAFSLALPQGAPPVGQFRAATEVLRTLPWSAFWWLQWKGQFAYLMTGSITDHPTYGRTPALARTPGIAWPVICVSLPAAYPVTPTGQGYGGLDVLTHELGHWFSRLFNGVWGDSSQPPLGYQKAWREKVWPQVKWPMGTQAADPDEALADSFAWLWMTRAGMHKKVPGRLADPCPEPAANYWLGVLKQYGWTL